MDDNEDSRRNHRNYKHNNGNNNDNNDDKSNVKSNDYDDSNNRKCSKSNQHEESVHSEYNDNISVGNVINWAKKYEKMKDLCDKYKKDNILLRAELRTTKGSHETTKRNVCAQFGWDGKEANLAKNVSLISKHTCFHATNSQQTSGTSLTQIDIIACQILLLKRLRSKSMRTTVRYGIE